LVCLSATQISQSSVTTLRAIFADEKLAKQIFFAAKRISKKRSHPDDGGSATAKKSRSSLQDDIPPSPREIEASLALPVYQGEEKDLAEIVVFTNRAPLVLAFAVSLLKYTMPDQPLSSRLSLAQAVVSLNSRSKAASIGLETGRSAIDEGWGKGQPVVVVMTREIPCLKRWGYDWKSEDTNDRSGQMDTRSAATAEEPALWGLDTEARRASNGAMANERRKDPNQLPVYPAEPARAYLFKSFLDPPDSEQETTEAPSSPKKKKLSGQALTKKKEENLSRLLAALDLLFESYIPFINKDELDRKAWACYVQVRPEVAGGVAGWGGKGEVPLKRILSLQRVKA
jgi:hypothetical protein